MFGTTVPGAPENSGMLAGVAEAMLLSTGVFTHPSHYLNGLIWAVQLEVSTTDQLQHQR